MPCVNRMARCSGAIPSRRRRQVQLPSLEALFILARIMACSTRYPPAMESCYGISRRRLARSRGYSMLMSHCTQGQEQAQHNEQETGGGNGHKGHRRQAKDIPEAAANKGADKGDAVAEREGGACNTRHLLRAGKQRRKRKAKREDQR